MRRNAVTVVGAAETTKLGVIPDLSQIGLHAAAAIEAGLAKTILITHGESGRSRIGNPGRPVPPQSLNGQFEQPYGPMGPPSMFTIPVLRYMKTYGVTEEQIAQVSVVQREWAATNPRATFK